MTDTNENPTDAQIKDTVQKMVGLHSKLKQATASLKQDRVKYREAKEWVGKFMQTAELEVIEVQSGGAELEVVSRKRKPSTSVTRKFLAEKMAQYMSENGGNVDVAGCLNWIFSVKPPPKTDYSISIRKAKKQKKKTKKLVEEPETHTEVVEEDATLVEDAVELSSM